MNQRHGEYFSSPTAKILIRFIRDLYNSMLMPRTTVFGSRSEMETEDLTELQVAC